MSRQDTVNPMIVKAAPIASAVYMGLGQILFLKQYVRGALFALLETIVLFLFAFESGTMALNFKGPLAQALVGLVTLGKPSASSGFTDWSHMPVRDRPHSIFMLITGLIVLIAMVLYFIIYAYNIISARKVAVTAVKTGKHYSFKETKHLIHDKAFPVVGLAPVLALIAFFTVVPLLFSALVGFTDYSSPNNIPPANLVSWVGFENFQQLFTASETNAWYTAFGRVAVWNITWAFFATFSCYFVGMFFAVILIDKRIKVSNVFRTIFVLPYAVPTLLSLLIWANLLNGTFGPINRTLVELGLMQTGIPWISDPSMAKVTMILVNIWIGFPYSMMLITSNMTAIPSQLYEAAIIDGANKFQQFWTITLPLVLFQTGPILVMQFAGNINNFGAVFFLTNGGPTLSDSIATKAGATDLMISWIYKLTIENWYNLASVLSLLVFFFLVPFAVFNFTRTKSFRDGEI